VTTAAAAVLSLVTVAVPAESASAQGISQMFGVRNLTGKTMTFTGWKAVDPNQGPRFDNTPPPPVGTPFPPAIENLFSMTYWFAYDNQAYLDYSIDGIGSFTVKARVDGFNKVTYGCHWATANIQCDASGHSVTVRSLNQAPMVIESTRPQEQADALKHLCDAQSPYVTCDFQPKGSLFEAAFPAKMVGRNYHANCGSAGNSEMRVTWTVEETTSDSVGGSFTATGKLGELVTLAVSANYQRTWSWSTSFSETHSKQVHPGFVAWYTQKTVWARVNGDFTAKIGNDTITIRDVWFAAPTNETAGVVSAHDKLMTPEDRRNLCGGGMTPPPLLFDDEEARGDD
jgi:hypothetical protein